MDITREENGALNAIIHIKLQEEDYAEAVNKQLNDYRKKANMPGFRPGKVPMGMIKKMYGTSVQAEEINKKVSEVLNKYIVEEKIDILGYPLPNIEKTQTIDFDKQKDFDFYFDIALTPEFDIKLDDKIKVPYYTITVSDEEIEKAIGDVKVRFGEEEDPEIAELTDGLQGKFVQLDEEGNPVDGGHEYIGYFKIEDMKLKTLQKKFVGKTIDDTEVFNVYQAFKDESKTKAVLGLQDGTEEQWKADYQFTIEKVVRLKEAEMGEELYKKVFPNDDLKTEEEFREKLSADLTKHYSRDADRQFLADTINKLIDTAKIDLPDEFMKRWLMESNQGKITQEQIDLQYDSYAKTFRWQLIESKLQEEFGDDIVVKEEEIRDKVRTYFSAMGGGDSEINPQIEGIIDSVLQNQEEKQKIQNDLLDEKFIALFKANVKMSNKKVTTEQFFEIASNTK
jgi:trigger factor